MSLIVYRIKSKYPTAKIEAVEVERVNDSWIWVKNVGRNGHVRVSREARRSLFQTYLDTWQEAHQALRDLAHQATIDATKALKDAEALVWAVHRMQEPVK